MRKWVLVLAIVAAGGMALVHQAGAADRSGPSWAPGSQVVSVGARTTVPGYDRDCGVGRGCVFGAAWSDDVDVEFGHNGCDTRNDVLRDRAIQFDLKPGTHGCVVAGGTVEDFYTGQVIEFVRGQGDVPQIDHVVPLAAAWDLGAADWPLAKRVDFANDPTNLVVTSRSVNAGKGDRTPGEWLPANLEAACRYVGRYTTVVAKYGVSVTSSDRAAIAQVLKQCAGVLGSDRR